ncbi:GNAT family N-acetyltransferase [Pedobacter sp. ISL-68]|uniref:GNAT family N-acetyltransferase n=1 Tax=unclassified Pedobacter TaxID=2628915 RepID=UPI001BE6DAA1|nr:MULTISPECIES: GNAT family N-acetyltransferase [unclassified Pedobacter]MBT2559763.1 GNAT family N-acetyltransferase [Pedobacter sp. ISL-64]MBT2592068.1 GNAT family N-acetyltransferase [Pedobacter sp. ISL-68]
MEHVLDNPIYYALTSGHSHIAKGLEEVKYYIEDITAFAGLRDNSQENLNTLYQISPAESLFVFFSKTPVEIPAQWELLTHIDMFQFVFRSKEIPAADATGITDLSLEHVTEMIDLVELTKPGPFLAKTIELSNYTGIFVDGKLAAMAGHRFHPSPYREVSAVCTHPVHLGKGYAFKILQEQIKRILLRSEIPFLHVRNDNEGAIKLYHKLGFEIRTDMIAYVIKKET